VDVDLEQRTIRAAIREIAEWPPAPPRPGGGLAHARAVLGNEAHRAYREERADEPGFQAEVPVVLRHEVDGFSVTLRGRADGVIESDRGQLVVEEVKAAAESRPAHRMQVRLYALALAQNRSPGIAARLILAGEPKAVTFDPVKVRQALDERLLDAIARARRDAQRAAERALAADALVFPYEQPRSGQETMMAEISRGLESERPVLVYAPTGIGKTAAALLPALRFALKNNRTLFFATAKTTQQAMVAETFLALRPPTAVRALTLRAKRAMCPPETLLCHPEHCAHLRSFLDESRRKAALDELLDRSSGAGAHISPDEVYAVGERATLCPHALSLALTREVELVVGDANYLFSSTATLDLERPVVVIDEAHNLFDRARNDLSPFVTRDQVRQLSDRLHANQIAAGSMALFDAVHAFLSHTLAALDGRAAWDRLAPEAAALMLRCATEEQTRDDRLFRLLENVVRIRDLLAERQPEFIPHNTDEGRGVLCLDPSRKLAERHAERAGTIAMSATLEPLGHFRTVLGFADMAPIECRVGSPFPHELRRIVAVSAIDTTYKRRAQHYGKIARLIRRVIDVRPGHYVAYFPSFVFLDAVRGLLPLLRDRLLVQHPSMSHAQRKKVLRRLRDDPEPLLLLAVMGGIFAEGVDLPGEALIGAIVVSPGLPTMGPERDAMRRHFDETTDGRGFLHALVYPGMQRVVQAAGRVHRTPEDKGVIVLLGRRFGQRPYSSCLPDDWQVEVTDDPVPGLEEFWGAAP